MASFPWRRVSGRRYENTETGEILSRRQYDLREGGALQVAGFTSYEAKAKTSTVEERLSRPAINRSRSAVPQSLSRLGPRIGKISREVRLPTLIEMEDPSSFEDYREKFTKTLAQIRRNKKVQATAFRIEAWGENFKRRELTVIMLTDPGSYPDFDKFVEAVYGLQQFSFDYSFEFVDAIIFHIRYFSSEFRPDKFAEARQLKIKAAKKKESRKRSKAKARLKAKRKKRK